MLATHLTENTCGEACWGAVEDICRCSCNGANHGCTRTEYGVQPARTRRIQGVMYQMAAVEAYPTYSCKAVSMRALENAQRMGDILKTASQSEVARWPELAAWRVEMTTYRPFYPLILWRKV